MSLEMLIGPMFAGKSSAIQSIIRRHQSLGWKVCVITHTMDTRYTTTPAIVNHDKQSLPAIATTTLCPLLEHQDYKQSSLVVIEESQFFPDLISFVVHVVEKDLKHAVVVGLDGDAERRPFGKVLELIPYCDKVTKLTALCKYCKDGTPAIFSCALSDDAVAAANAGKVCVGADERYVPLCRKHYLKAHAPPTSPTHILHDDIHQSVRM